VKSYAVIGLGFGDEGKGMFTDLLCSRLYRPLVVRFSGGQQAGHTVYRDEKISHVFSSFGSGSFRGVPAYWSKYCTIDPVGMVNEHHVLETTGITPELHIDPRCPVTTPFEIRHNRKTELENKHGSCGVGVGATWERELNHYSLTYSDLFYPSILKIRMDQINRYYGETIPLDDFYQAVSIITSFKNIMPDNESFLKNYSSIIFEGSQGLLLDQNFGFFPHVTRSNTGTRNILEMGYKPYAFLITRAYQTRHGTGPMTNEHIRHTIKTNPLEKNEQSSMQGEFRKTVLDLDLLTYAIQKDDYIRATPRKALVITCLDLLENYQYTKKGRLHKCPDMLTFVTEIQEHLGIEEAFGTVSPVPDMNQSVSQRVKDVARKS